MPSLAEVEAEHIRKVLEMTESNIRQTAEILGISRSTLYAKLRKAGVEIPELRKSKGRWRRKRS
jgi:DNA-binding NtrC family response regulator